MSALQRGLLKNLPPLHPPASKSDKSKPRMRDYSPLPWSDYFDKFEDVKIPGKKNFFRVYFRGQSGPALLLLHGGGHSALSWAVFSVSVTQMVDCQVIAMDIRGHGSSCTDDEEDLSAECLVNDIIDVTATVFSEESPPPIVLVGHSMGGALAVRVASRNVISTLVGLAAIDVVEGTAMESLSSMQSFLRGRPQSFSSLEKAVEWSIRSGQLRNVESARVSMPGQLRSGQLENVVSAGVSMPGQLTRVCAVQETIKEEQENSEGVQAVSESLSPSLSEVQMKSERMKVGHLLERVVAGPDHGYSWRIDLNKTEPFWSGWFSGLSQIFLSTPVPKILILAGVDRLDKELSIGQMQGKFQLQVLAGCGHSIHEDLPDKVSEIIASFLVRYKFAEPKGDFKRPFPAC